MRTPQPRPALTHGPMRALSEKPEERKDHMLWLDKNESIDPAYVQFIKTIISDIPASALFAYPDCFAVYHKLAAYLQTDINQLLIAAGSDGVIRSIYEAFVSPGDVVIYPEPTFLMYSLYVKIYGAKGVVLDYMPSDSGPILPVEMILQAIEKNQPKLVCLPNPGSPTGTVFKQAELRTIIEAAGCVGAVMLIDEAYYPFYAETVLPWINEYPHLVITRSFSKAWGLAGIRMGYGAACKELIYQLHKVRPRYEIGALSAAVAERVLSYPDKMLASVQRINEGKQFFLKEMEKLGFRTLHAEGNFFHVAFGNKATAIHDTLSNHVLYQKNFNHPALAGYSRFTSTTSALFSPLVKKIKDTVLGVVHEPN